MLTGFARQFNLPSLPKAGYQLGLTSVLLLAGIGSVHDASALNETRTLSFHHTHSGEDLTVTFKREGRYDEEALRQLNHFLRDWRTQDQTTMDRHLFDIIWEVYRDVDGKKPIQIISAYRSPETNAMLRHRSAHSGVARFSQHMLGHAMDFYIPDVPLEQIRFAGLRLQRGGVGFYPTSGSPFVHLDTGNIRHWPRMTHDQLVRVFPDGRTVHVPSDGSPLKGYELARAEIERRGNGDDAATVAKPPNLLARLFGGKSGDDEDEGSTPAVQAKAVPTVQVAAAKPADAAPAPRTRMTGATLQLAAADTQIVQPVRPKQPTASDRAEAKPQTPADIINARGFWDDMPAAPNQASPAQIAAINARKALASTDPQSTSSVPAAYQAMAYAPEASAPVDHPSAPHGARAASTGRNSLAANEVTTVIAKGQSQTKDGVVANATRLVASQATDVWMRLMMLAPSARTAMSVTMLGDANMTLLSTLFVKPRASVVMGFSDDPLMGLTTDRFSGPAMAPLTIQSFGLRTASLR
ncbi:MAG TPA: DUF882 domain-containing protein [Bradyrhizobium sp.]|uniref:DUF882 domain-containing protein n=1 Tax=Bradyrhizobium sp. TaxID=376 RepID=UPI002D7E271B|nr:DUF882 domain-containing protein [Bradyrhizobium sp.]HET7884655.1 DUF882 domain-containing protein [Bradyrhizobium sp.]